MVKKTYLVKREIVATSLEKALKVRGSIYEVVLADEKSWPKPKKTTGFKQK